MVVVDDDSLLSNTTWKTPAKKAKTYTDSEQWTIDRLNLWLKSEGQHCQYSKELADLVKYWNENVPNLWQAPNMDDHSAHLATVKKKSWCYLAKGNLQTVKQFMQDLYRCGDLDKIERGEKMLQDRGMPRIPQENTPLGAKRECIKACYVMRVLRSIEGEIVDSTHPHFGREQNIGLHDIVSQESMNWIEKNGQLMYGGKMFQGQVDAGYCPLCPYSSQSHWTFNNHVRLYFHTSMVCGMVDCWYVSHSAESMWKHAVEHGLATTEPIAQTKHSKKK